MGTGPGDLRAETTFLTTTPEETIDRAIDFFRPYQEEGVLAAVGIGSFGPVDLNYASPTFGYVTSTPKPGWAYTQFAGRINQALRVPIGFDTDANAAALGEAVWGAAQGLDVFVYLTVGTGIGGGAIVNGQPLHGLLHPEMGHLRVSHDWERDPYFGACPFHGDCLEGLAAGPGLVGRWGRPGESLPPDHEAWVLEAHYLAMGLVNLICALSPERIILGGGIMQQTRLFSMVRLEVKKLLNGYLQVPALLEQIDNYIVPAALGSRAGLIGAIELAKKAVAGRA